MASFTMLFVDLDNTLIPSRIRRVIQHQFGIDIFDTLSSTLLKELQYSIIKCIDQIKNILEKQKNEIIIAVVSNGTTAWIKKHLIYTENGEIPIFSILAKYLKRNNIGIHSASDEMYDFLKHEYGEEAAINMFNNMKHKDNDKEKWVLKYNTFSTILLKYRRKENKKCNTIISFGDGDDEAMALNNYSLKFNIKSYGIKFIDSPTINQLQEQWKYIEDNFKNIMATDTNGFNSFDLNEIIKSDNNKKCSGNSHQIKAIGIYFKLWMKYLEETQDVKHKIECVNKCTAMVHHKISSGKRVKHLKIIVSHLKENSEFNAAFIKHEQIINDNA